MPPRARKASTPADDASLDVVVPEPVPAEELPCPLCFPAGWAETATACGCEHGSWVRTPAAD